MPYDIEDYREDQYKDFQASLNDEQEEEKPAAEEPNESKINENDRKEIIFPHDFPNKILAGRGGYIEKIVDDVAYINFHDNSNDERMWMPVPVDSLQKTF